MKALYYIKTSIKAKFLRSERNDDVYWLQFSYAEFLRSMKKDTCKCKSCGIYSWEGLGKRCNCSD